MNTRTARLACQKLGNSPGITEVLVGFGMTAVGREERAPMFDSPHDSSSGKSGKKKHSLANVGIEPKTFALLARRSNQLS
ncbi:hypothetical protein BDN72DRAFT_535131 [Pluteus cervinus]|uniref:Uncharacterized protein n=1 Tax=Pluteus cervinus TaxID=181527 RepID=A0ACD3A3R1_9AGAR|nr:hypothetical protein BDN72DRAFT_535131 [Pluteus cervinus]